ncbi:trans-sulfuration enzyme family protein [Pelosinus propionicus]|uniref:Cystathionine beta-lyase n=1 Tax=Pelosinus propionicus DSM 13327 TaxID=1123291 RepID=A0A1I4Q8S6_9FIRM|nr:PLP-dependent transferase [Pelosinus propionicus]SFM36501.1 cystathionine beta-lyase [Pelosinus propionicus DSM 13327]
MESKIPEALIRCEARRTFLALCSPKTQLLHDPISDPYAVCGHPNPSGLGEASCFSQKGSWGQSSVLFPKLATYRTADKCGKAPYGGAEYGVPQTPEADAVCRKIAALHKGHGAVICPSGLSAIATTLDAFSPKAVLIPDNVYGPMLRFLNRRKIKQIRYSAGASKDEFLSVLLKALSEYSKREDLIVYIEAPGSGTFEIPDIHGMIAIAQDAKLRTIMDNTWASHVRFQPLEHGIDIVVQATTKYEGGYGDTPSGIVIAKHPQDLQIIADELRANGNGAVAPTTCSRLYHRLDSAEERLDQHADTAQRLIQWFLKQPFVTSVLSPSLETSPYHERFQRYFGKGNGLFSVVFRPDLSTKHIEAFVDALNLFWVAESWGGHLSLVLPVHANREVTPKPDGYILRFHAGLEDYQDLLRDLNQAAGCL